MRQLGRKGKESDARTARVLINSASTPASVTDHGSLSGLGDDDHAQYASADGSGTRSAYQAERLSKSVIAGNGLTGGGLLTADATLNVGAGTLIAVAADSVGISVGTAQYQVITTGATPFTPAWSNFGLIGTAAQNYTFPAAGGTVALLNAANNFTAINTFSNATDATTISTGGVVISGGVGITKALWVGGLMNVAGALSVNSISSSLIPTTTDTYDLGSSIKLWRKGWLSELDAILFAQNTITLIGGWLLVGKGEGVIPADIPLETGSHNYTFTTTASLAVNDFILFRAALAVEYMQVTAIVGGGVFTVTRNLDGTGANAWPAGSVFENLGYNGNGRIELNANSTPRISLITQGTTYNAQTELIRLGDLNGAWGYGAETYGLAMGQYGVASKTSLTMDDAAGIRLFNNTTVIGQWDASGNFKIGTNVSAAATTKLFVSNASQTYNSETGYLAGDVLIGDNTSASNLGNIRITAAGTIKIRRGVTDYITLDAADAQFTNKIKMLGASSAIAIGVAATLPSSATVGTGIWIDRSGLYGLNANVQQAYINATGQLMAGAGNVILDASGVYIMPMAVGGFYVDYYGLNFGLPGSVFSAITGVIDGLNDASTFNINVNNVAGTKKLDFTAQYSSGATPTSYFAFSILGTPAFYINATKVIVAGGLNVGTGTGAAGSGGVVADIAQSNSGGATQINLTNSGASNAANLVYLNWEALTSGAGAATRPSFLIAAGFSTTNNATRTSTIYFQSADAGAFGNWMIVTGINAQYQGDLVSVGGFGCNTKAAQTAYASGGALAAYATGASGLDTTGHMSALYAMVVAIRAALVADGIMS